MRGKPLIAIKALLRLFYGNYNSNIEQAYPAMITHPNPVTRSLKAFSQFEAILSLAIMSIIGAIAVPLVSNVTDSSKLSVLKSNLHHMNSILREAHRAGSVTTNIDSLGSEDTAATVSDVCDKLTQGAGLFIDIDGDGTMDPHEIGFEMDIPPSDDAYDYLIGQHLTDDFTVKIEGDSPIQLAIYKSDTLYEIP